MCSVPRRYAWSRRARLGRLGRLQARERRRFAPFEPVRCHGFITESTFGLPIYRWRPQAEPFAAIDAWRRGTSTPAARASLRLCFGKAQRVLARCRSGRSGRSSCHGAVEPLNALYREAGVDLAADAVCDGNCRQGRVLGAPSSSHRRRCSGRLGLRRFGDYSDALTGQRLDAGARRAPPARRRSWLCLSLTTPTGRACSGAIERQARARHGHPWVRGGDLARWLPRHGLERVRFATAYGDGEDADDAGAPMRSRGWSRHLLRPLSMRPKRSAPPMRTPRMKRFARLFAELDATTATSAKADALKRNFAARRRASGLDGLFPRRRQAAPDRAVPPALASSLSRRSGIDAWLLRRRDYGAVGDFAEMRRTSFCLRRMGSDAVSLDVWVARAASAACAACYLRSRRYATAQDWVDELATAGRLPSSSSSAANFASASAAAWCRGARRSRGRRREASWPNGGSAIPTRRVSTAAVRANAQLIARLAMRRPRRSTRASPIRSSCPLVRHAACRDAFDARFAAGLARRVEVRRHSRTTPEARRELAPVVCVAKSSFPTPIPILSRWRARCPRARRSTASSSYHPARARVRDGFARWSGDLREPPAAPWPQDRQRKDAAGITGRVDRLRSAGERGPRSARRAAAYAAGSARTAHRSLVRGSETRGERLPIQISPTVSADTWEELEKREQARALTREGLMLKARDGAGMAGARAATARTCGGNGSSTR